MDINIDKETDKFCNALLKEIAELNRKLSTQITRRVNNHPRTKDNKMLRKLGRVSIVYTEHYALYERAVENLRDLPEWRSTPPDSVVSAIYRNVYKLITEIKYSGSVESKYEKKW